MVNVTEIIKEGQEVIGPLSKISQYVKNLIIDLGIKFPDKFSMVLTFFIGTGLVWIGTKIANKVAKVLLIILGIILIIGIILSIIS